MDSLLIIDSGYNKGAVNYVENNACDVENTVIELLVVNYVFENEK